VYSDRNTITAYEIELKKYYGEKKKINGMKKYQYILYRKNSSVVGIVRVLVV